MTVTIRGARPRELVDIVALEAAADAAFLTLDPPIVFEPTPVDDLRPSCAFGRLLVADHDGHLCGFVRIEVIDHAPHIEQVSVHPAYAGLSIGAALLTSAEQWATTRGFHAMTLTTYRDLPWNGPYYTRLGWTVLSPPEQSPGLKALRAREKHHGLDLWPRQAMIKHL